MKNFTHGIMAIDSQPDENDSVEIVHFIGLWEAPTKEAFLEYEKEIKNDPEFGLVEIANRIEVLPAPKDIVDYYSKIVQESENNKN
jgi:hypothetical protein